MDGPANTASASRYRAYSRTPPWRRTAACRFQNLRTVAETLPNAWLEPLSGAWRGTPIAGHTLCGHDLDVLNTEAGQLLRPESPPKSQQNQTAVTGVSQCGGVVTLTLSPFNAFCQPAVHPLQDLHLQRPRPVFRGVVHGPDSFEGFRAQTGGICPIR